ncbi:MAG TPA: site-2 protease family protein [Solirubrobacteraceae bacterium]|nr:site-2 protease family protein [Solirubrobacteraceae bacterium]
MFRTAGSIKLLRVAGIRIGVDGTWFVMLFLMIFLLNGSFRSALGSSSGVAYLTTVVTVMLFFVSLILHELGHAFAARREGITVTRIELYLFGGVTQMSRDADSPGEEFRIAVAGPLGTLLFGLLCGGVDLAIVGPSRLWDAVRLNGAVHLTPVLLSLSWLLAMNAAILVFNLIPAYPLDGGRIARSIVWARTHSKLTGTRAAATLGQWLALLIGGGGLLLVLQHDTFSGIWLMVIAYMIYSSARASLRQSQVSARMDAIRVSDIMDHEPVTVSSRTSAESALDDYFNRYGAQWLPVVDESGHLLGISQRTAVEAAAHAGEGDQSIALMLEAEDGGTRVSEDRPLSELLSVPALGRLGGLVAVDGNGVVRGVVTLDQVKRALVSLFPQPQA